MKYKCDFEFKTCFSLKNYLEGLKNVEREMNNSSASVFIQSLFEEAEKIPELLEDEITIDTINQNMDTLNLLMTPILGTSVNKATISGIAKPFSTQFIFTSQAMEDFLKEHEILTTCSVEINLMDAYTYILYRYYGRSYRTTFRENLLHFKNKKTGKVIKMRLEMNISYCDLILKGKLPEINDDVWDEIEANLDDVSVMAKYIPQDLFEFNGMSIIQMYDITRHYLLNDIKNLLLKKQAIIDYNNMLEIEEKYKQLLDIDELFVKVNAIRNSEILLLHNHCTVNMDEMKKNIIMNISDFEDSILSRVIFDKERACIPNLEKYKNLSKIEYSLLEQGYRSLMLLPLTNNDKTIGFLFFGSKKAYELNPIRFQGFEELEQAFATAVVSSLEDYENQVQLFIQKKYTAIHESVAWRFRKEARKVLDKLRQGQESETEEIIFNHIYPLYAVSDIRSSSKFRNKAIQADLMTQLNMAKEVLQTGYEIKGLPLLDELMYRIDVDLDNLKNRLDTGDEIRIMNFLKHEIETCFNDLMILDDRIKEKVDKYRLVLDKELGALYCERKAYDESVMKINRTISDYIDMLQPSIQKMFPHYFDKQLTDGVDQSIYIGQELVEDMHFDIMYLRNIRLWQLIVMIGIVYRAELLKEDLQVKLDTHHLILVQDMPITIRFDEEEKSFRVDGAYNIRYEIMKKRIDKAVVKGTGERMTQPHKIAIVFSQAKESIDYWQFIKYLQAKGFLEYEVEELLLEELQGIRGIQALRVEVKFDEPEKQIEKIDNLIMYVTNNHTHSD